MKYLLKALNGPLKGKSFPVEHALEQGDTIHLPPTDHVYKVGEIHVDARTRIRYLFHIGSSEAEALGDWLE